MTDRAEKFYLVDKKSEAHKIIVELFEQRRLSFKARNEFMYSHFPESKPKKSGWAVAYWSNAFGGGHWAISAPAGATLPADWKYCKKSQTWSPRHSTKAGKLLHAEMNDKKYFAPGASDFGAKIGCPPAWKGFSLLSPAILTTSDDRFILGLADCHKVPAGAKRISDIEAEKLRAPKKKAAAKKRAPAKA